MNRRVLVVEDEPIIRMVLSEVLLEAGWDVVLAKDGPEARARLGPDFSIVMFDVRLPGADGVDLVTELRRVNPGCHIIVMSGHGTAETVHRAAAAGADRFLHKPFSFEEVAALLASIERGDAPTVPFGAPSASRPYFTET